MSVLPQLRAPTYDFYKFCVLGKTMEIIDLDPTILSVLPQLRAPTYDFYKFCVLGKTMEIIDLDPTIPSFGKLLNWLCLCYHSSELRAPTYDFYKSRALKSSRAIQIGTVSSEIFGVRTNIVNLKYSSQVYHWHARDEAS